MVYFSQNATFSYRLYKKLRLAKNKLNNDGEAKPKWMRKKIFEQLQEKIFELGEKREIANFFSLRNHRSVNTIFDKYGSAIGAAEILGS
jgi:replicative DNA helicase